MTIINDFNLLFIVNYTCFTVLLMFVIAQCYVFSTFELNPPLLYMLKFLYNEDIYLTVWREMMKSIAVFCGSSDGAQSIYKEEHEYIAPQINQLLC